MHDIVFMTVIILIQIIACTSLQKTRHSALSTFQYIIFFGHKKELLQLVCCIITYPVYRPLCSFLILHNLWCCPHRFKQQTPKNESYHQYNKGMFRKKDQKNIDLLTPNLLCSSTPEYDYILAVFVVSDLTWLIKQAYICTAFFVQNVFHVIHVISLCSQHC